jgi:hypothetical protein
VLINSLSKWCRCCLSESSKLRRVDVERATKLNASVMSLSEATLLDDD